MKALQIVKYGKIEDSMAFTEVNQTKYTGQ